MSNFRKWYQVALFSSLLLCACLLAGCGKSAGPSVDSAPFQAAITDYLSEHSMGMQVTEFKELDVRDESATATCVLKDAEGLYAMGVTWRFNFEKDGEGWKVLRHEAR